MPKRCNICTHTFIYRIFSLCLSAKKEKKIPIFTKSVWLEECLFLEPISCISSMTLAREMMFIWIFCMNLVSNHICLAFIAKNDKGQLRLPKKKKKNKGQLARAWSTIEASDISLDWRPALLTLKKAKKQLLSCYFCLVYWHFFPMSSI